MTTIWVTFEQEGWHCWPEAPAKRAYLAQPHRHLFHFNCEVQVGNPDREIEMHDFLDSCRETLSSIWDRSPYSIFALDFQDTSCEGIAISLLVELQKKYPHRWLAVEVSEDGECGAGVEVAHAE